MDTTMERRRISWKLPHVSADGLKLFACITMMVQTIGIAVVEKGMIHLNGYTQAGLSEALSSDSRMMFLAGIGSGMQLIGGFAVPIFAFLLVEGFLKTSSYRNYLLSIVIFAVLSEIPYDLAMSQKFVDWSAQNALVTMGVCLLMLYFLQMMKGKTGIFSMVAQIAVIVCAVVWVLLLRADYGLCMVLLTSIFYLFHDRNVLKTVLGIVVSLMYVTGPLAFYGLWCYNEERKDKLPKYVYYLFYPVHLLVLGVIAKYYMGA